MDLGNRHHKGKKEYHQPKYQIFLLLELACALKAPKLWDDGLCQSSIWIVTLLKCSLWFVSHMQSQNARGWKRSPEISQSNPPQPEQGHLG